MNDKNFIETYFDIFQKKALNSNIYKELILLKNMIIQTKKKNGKVILIGNGGSSAIASHISVDLNKAVGIKSMNFNEYDFGENLDLDKNIDRSGPLPPSDGMGLVAHDLSQFKKLAESAKLQELQDRFQEL